MHFRIRNNIVQVIRTTYDAATKKPRAQIVGRLNRTRPEAGPELLAACTPAEAEEVQRWIAGHSRARAVATEHAARTLAEQCAMAAQWLASTEDLDSARSIAADAQQQWVKLRNQLRRRGILD